MENPYLIQTKSGRIIKRLDNIEPNPVRLGFLFNKNLTLFIWIYQKIIVGLYSISVEDSSKSSIEETKGCKKTGPLKGPIFLK
jgi:hypothetical protein